MNRKSLSALSGWLWYFFIAGAVAGGLNISYWQALLIVFAVAFILLSVFICVYYLLEWRKKLRRCVHGVRAGAAGACHSCTIEREHELEIRKQQAAEHERLADIKRRAQTLRVQEIERLSKVWLSNSEVYYSMAPRTFEDAIAQLFRQLGYAVQQTPYSNDFGKDAILSKDGKKFLVECKRYGEANSIGRPEIQKFFAAMHDEGATGGFYVNTGRFSPEAKKYANAHEIVLYDRHTFPSLVIEAYPIAEDASAAKTMCLECGAIVEIAVQDSAVSTTCPLEHLVIGTVTRADLNVFTPAGVPYCEICGSSMRVVKGYRGRFWGCSRYPKCKFKSKFSHA